MDTTSENYGRQRVQNSPLRALKNPPPPLKQQTPLEESSFQVEKGKEGKGESLAYTNHP